MIPEHVTVGSNFEVTTPRGVVKVEIDTCRDRQEEFDEEYWGKFYSFSRRHNNFYGPAAATKDGARIELTKKFGKGIRFLGYYEHGLGCWFPEGAGGPGTECPFDGVQFAGFWVPGKYTPRGKGRAKAFRDACVRWTQWWNGDVYDILVSPQDDADDEPTLCATAWGAENLREEIKSLLSSEFGYTEAPQ